MNLKKMYTWVASRTLILSDTLRCTWFLDNFGQTLKFPGNLLSCSYKILM